MIIGRAMRGSLVFPAVIISKLELNFAAREVILPSLAS